MPKPASEQAGHLDPICGRRVSEQDRVSSEYKKRRYYFCSERCRCAFEHQAERFRVTELAKVGALLAPTRVRWGLA